MVKGIKLSEWADDKKVIIREDIKGNKINLGTSAYGMKNVIMTYVETFLDKCSKSGEKSHNHNECIDCTNIDYWNCSGCGDEEGATFYGNSYSMKCHCCGAGVPQQY